MKKEILIDTGTYDVNENVHKITDYRCVSADMQHKSIKERLLPAFGYELLLCPGGAA